jgi:hypothetical protein
MTPEQLATWRQLADAATPGTWAVDYISNLVSTDDQETIDNGWQQICEFWGDDDAAFIAAARTAVPALLAEVERLTAENDNLRNTKVNVDETEWIRVSEYVKLRRRLAEYERNAAYISGIIDSGGAYIP